jgi:diguanylate cyclase
MRAQDTKSSPLVESRRQRVEQALTELKLLPTCAAVPMKVLEMKRRQSAGAAEFALVISADPALSAKVLAMANSAAFSPRRPVTRLSSAVAQIGLNNLLPLVFGLSFAGIFNKLSLPPTEQMQMWRASLLKAVTAREAMRLFASPNDPAKRDADAEEAFFSGLFQDVALPLFYFADHGAWNELVTVVDLPDPQRRERERRLYGIDHAEAAGRCARQLRLPSFFVQSVEFHHADVEESTAEMGQLALAVDAAACLPHRMPSLAPRHLQSLLSRLQQTAGLSTQEIADLIQRIVESFGQLSKLFADPQDPSASFKEFLQNLSSEVVACFESSISHSTAEINSLKEKERRVRAELTSLQEKAAQAERDPLTKALTRPAFMSRLSKLLALAQDNDVACAVGFIDLDDFKLINDTYGHAAGDAALVQLVATLGEALRGRGLVGRLGGDEFVFAVVSRTTTLEQDLAEFKERTARLAMTFNRQEIKITTSVGIVSIDVPETRDAPERIIKEADLLMYQAKRGGKGRASIGRLSDAPPVAGAALKTSAA